MPLGRAGQRGCPQSQWLKRALLGCAERLDEILAAAEPALRPDAVDADSRAATVKQRPSSRRITPAEISVSGGGGQTHLGCLHFWGGVHLWDPPLQGWLRGTPQPLPGTLAMCWVAPGASGRLCATPGHCHTQCAFVPPPPLDHSQGHRLLRPAVHQPCPAPSVPRPLLAGPIWDAGARQQHAGTTAWGV